ncbi:hypothetical protein A4D02_29345 [Niastella koreensis]|uniref:YCII-related protein n=2 Tax=Niastella koreensis TaxID=354356 RepID=G8TPE1_NIAKG|nr:hypothetical protein [Niastella koreensis]AEV96747.1 hypothetical protein Niako_0349 [Niastella koreensis GR20-10]OQP49104.1 hypothetical protein A4D02_29345 [Niastella koreensis]
MSNPAFAFTSPEIMTKLATIKPYVLVVLTKGENYGLSDTPRIIQSEHLPYIFDQRRDNEMVLTMPVMDNNTDLAAICIYNTKDKAEVKRLMDSDPAIRAGVFNYEIVTGMGLPGDKLP